MTYRLAPAPHAAGMRSWDCCRCEHEELRRHAVQLFADLLADALEGRMKIDAQLLPAAGFWPSFRAGSASPDRSIRADVAGLIVVAA